MKAPLSHLAAFGIRPGEYEHFTFDASTAATVTTFVIAICIGILLAALYNFYQRNVPGAIVRAILREKALSEKDAKTAAQLGLEGKFLFLWELTHGTALRRTVRFVGDTAYDARGKRPKQNAETRYYIPEEGKYRAEIRFEKKGNGLIALLITCALTAVLAILIIKLLPWFLSIVDKIM